MASNRWKLRKTSYKYYFNNMIYTIENLIEQSKIYK